MELFVKLDNGNVKDGKGCFCEEEFIRLRITNVGGWGTLIELMDKSGNAFKSYQIMGNGYATVDGKYSDE
jgi:hypothetical protein